MLCRVMLCIVLATSSAASSPEKSVPRSLKLLMDLLNEVIACSVSFDNDFGSGVSLLHGKAEVFVYKSIELVEVSRQQMENTMLLRSPLGFRIITESSLDDLNLAGCTMRMSYSVDNSSRVAVTKPIAVWVDSCDKISFTNGNQPERAENILPLLSQALQKAAIHYLSFNGSKRNVDLMPLRRVVGFMMTRGVLGSTMC